MVVYIKDVDDFKAKLKEAGDKLVVIDFTATWCNPCRSISPEFEKLAEQYTNVIFYKVDVDEADDVAKKCDVSCMPTFQFYKNGKQIDIFSGADLDKLKNKVQELQ